MPFARLDDTALARRSVYGWCETVAALGRCGPGLEEVRLPSAVGARAVDRSGPLASNHYFDSVVVPYDTAPPGVSYLPLSYAAGRQLAGVPTLLSLRSSCSKFGVFPVPLWVLIWKNLPPL